MKTIQTLIPDIQYLLEKKDVEEGYANGLAVRFSQDLSKQLCSRLSGSTQTPKLRLSALGPRCPRALWYSINRPELRSPLPPWTELKFTFGDIVEGLALFLARAAGHEVTGEQDELELDGIVGHRDCVIDGAIVDVKSASSRSFIKFKTGSIAQDDPFGYLDQLDGYTTASLNDPLVRVKDRAYILAIDKTLGHMVLYEHITRPDHIRGRIQNYRSIVSLPTPPPCECKVYPEGASGNLRLDVKASYSPYKHLCFPGLRTFRYSTGPVDFAVVKRKPEVPEIFH